MTAMLVSGLLPRGVSADEAPSMDPLLEATLQLKIQTYDHNLGARAQKHFVIGILYSDEVTGSEGIANEMREAFLRISETYRLKNVKPTVVVIKCDPTTLFEVLRKQQISMIYVTPGLGNMVKAITVAASALKIPTTSNVREFISNGIGIGVVVDQHKPKIVINLKAVASTGMELDAELLGLAEVWR